MSEDDDLCLNRGGAPRPRPDRERKPAMIFKSITFARGATVNRGNFNSDRVEVAAVVEIAEGESEDAAFDKAVQWVNQRVKEEIHRK